MFYVYYINCCDFRKTICLHLFTFYAKILLRHKFQTFQETTLWQKCIVFAFIFPERYLCKFVSQQSGMSILYAVPFGAALFLRNQQPKKYYGGNMEVCLGMKADGKLLNTTLAEMHSLVIGGYSGCGKTALVNNLITQLSNAEIYIFDVKKIDFKRYENKSNIFLVHDSATMQNVLRLIKSELINRISQYDTTAKPIILIVDAFELYDYPSCSKIDGLINIDFDILPQLKEIVDGAKFGVHLILTSQYTTNREDFKYIKRNSSVLCMSDEHRKFFLQDIESKHFPKNCNYILKMREANGNNLIELVSKYLPFTGSIISN